MFQLDIILNWLQWQHRLQTLVLLNLSNTIVTSLALISKSLINRTDVDIVPFIVNEIAKAIAYFLEKELLNNANSSVGSGATKLGGLANASNYRLLLLLLTQSILLN
jgi:hypothetical protein